MANIQLLDAAFGAGRLPAVDMADGVQLPVSSWAAGIDSNTGFLGTLSGRIHRLGEVRHAG